MNDILHYLLSEQIVDPESGEVLGRSGEIDPPRLIEYIAHCTDVPQWLRDALITCYQDTNPIPEEAS